MHLCIQEAFPVVNPNVLFRCEALRGASVLDRSDLIRFLEEAGRSVLVEHETKTPALRNCRRLYSFGSLVLVTTVSAVNT